MVKDLRVLVCDPPEGWRYGFPQPYDLKPGESHDEWLLRHGYPQRLIDKGYGETCGWSTYEDEEGAD